MTERAGKKIFLDCEVAILTDSKWKSDNPISSENEKNTDESRTWKVLKRTLDETVSEEAWKNN